MTPGRKTDIRRAERRTGDDLGEFAAQLTEIIPVIVQLYDVVEERLVFVNSRVRTLLGYAPDGYAELAGGNWDPLIHPNDRSVVWETLETLRRAGDRRVVESTFRIRHADGSYRWFSASATTFARDDDGTVRSVLAALQDITDRKRLERGIANRSLIEQRLLGRELHDTVGQQVTAIAFLAKSLQRKLEDRGMDESEIAATLVESSDKAKQQVRALMRGLMPVEIDAHGLAGALEDLAHQRESVYGVRCPVETKGQVALDDNTAATHLYKIAQEATLNAIKHGKARNLTLRLYGDDRDLTLEVEDDGAGFDAEEVDGDGVGLHIMRHRASLIGGSVEVISSRREGTRITCRVPLTEL
ncbi:MAG: PAS domain-containing protein [Gemmatimonadetes bacterium]|uniref:Oxygen sensor histidine kinase NreB n=1 Tax=Candidatus Kutchimonas denitrificans TaxID=3056748 RepID=A0AAE4ZC95_9BACT|nr:PAS domain-containing protein [Gemmatimonadota bacterium]NIR76722.1 PAS domain-containing protein [Candidatus Kutchimonas denitrificans]NIS01209.1 PAS domain-containing protein [Gemmatimonadota bacterium]NIT68248.1 PAS domain-containing protein [Gemmatimonadota bacterium]NIW75466.1 PAS domain-containing protein [Gemmatimonadota bacterium]